MSELTITLNLSELAEKTHSSLLFALAEEMILHSDIDSANPELNKTILKLLDRYVSNSANLPVYREVLDLPDDLKYVSKSVFDGLAGLTGNDMLSVIEGLESGLESFKRQKDLERESAKQGKDRKTDNKKRESSDPVIALNDYPSALNEFRRKWEMRGRGGREHSLDRFFATLSENQLIAAFADYDQFSDNGKTAYRAILTAHGLDMDKVRTIYDKWTSETRKVDNSTGKGKGESAGKGNTESAKLVELETRINGLDDKLERILSKLG